MCTQTLSPGPGNPPGPHFPRKAEPPNDHENSLPSCWAEGWLDLRGVGTAKTVEKVPLLENRLRGWVLQAVLMAKLSGPSSPSGLQGCASLAESMLGRQCSCRRRWRVCGDCCTSPRRTNGLHHAQRSPHEHRTAQMAGGVVVRCAALLGVRWERGAWQELASHHHQQHSGTSWALPRCPELCREGGLVQGCLQEGVLMP